MTREEAIRFAINAAEGMTAEGALWDADAFTTALAEHGYVIVPKEPTLEMKEALVAHYEKYPATIPEPKATAWDALHGYRAMISTAGGG